ncbi:hypothetical protein FRC00_009936 [Tulasnella sp. 408]|nr:hypothetical protein FRC00_009936 [Tulasnella sp. 408]
MNYISNLKGQLNDDDNAFAMGVMNQIRKALVPEFLGGILLGKKRRAELMQEFEGAFSELWSSKLGVANDGLQKNSSEAASGTFVIVVDSGDASAGIVLGPGGDDLVSSREMTS